jgi:hypothetical protein
VQVYDYSPEKMDGGFPGDEDCRLRLSFRAQAMITLLSQFFHLKVSFWRSSPQSVGQDSAPQHALSHADHTAFGGSMIRGQFRILCSSAFERLSCQGDLGLPHFELVTGQQPKSQHVLRVQTVLEYYSGQV